jgi:hypothetical protein
MSFRWFTVAPVLLALVFTLFGPVSEAEARCRRGRCGKARTRCHSGGCHRSECAPCGTSCESGTCESGAHNAGGPPPAPQG